MIAIKDLLISIEDVLFAHLFVNLLEESTLLLYNPPTV